MGHTGRDRHSETSLGACLCVKKPLFFLPPPTTTKEKEQGGRRKVGSEPGSWNWVQPSGRVGCWGGGKMEVIRWTGFILWNWNETIFINKSG